MTDHEIIDAYDEDAIENADRREFLKKLTRLAGGTAAAARSKQFTR